MRRIQTGFERRHTRGDGQGPGLQRRSRPRPGRVLPGPRRDRPDHPGPAVVVSRVRSSRSAVRPQARQPGAAAEAALRRQVVVRGLARHAGLGSRRRGRRRRDRTPSPPTTPSSPPPSWIPRRRPLALSLRPGPRPGSPGHCSVAAPRTPAVRASPPGPCWPDCWPPRRRPSSPRPPWSGWPAAAAVRTSSCASSSTRRRPTSSRPSAASTPSWTSWSGRRTG